MNWKLKKKKPLTSEEGEDMARKVGADCYIECSALHRENVREVFETAARAALRKKKRHNRFGRCIFL